jgi:hypothetical protein
MSGKEALGNKYSSEDVVKTLGLTSLLMANLISVKFTLS